MAKVYFKRKTTQEIEELPVEDGSLIYNTDNGKTYMDFGDDRIQTGGNADTMIAIGGEEPTDTDVKIWFPNDVVNTKASEVVNSMDGDETDMSPSVHTVREYVNNKFNFNVINDLDIGPNETVSEYSEQIKNAKIIIFAISCQGNTSAGSSSMFYIPNSGYAMYKTDFTADNKAFYIKTDENGNVITTDFNYDGQSKIKRIFYL